MNERTHLLSDPVSNNYSISASTADYGNHYSSSLPHKSDEQSALNRILQQTANNVIDVGALECHTLEQHEYIERVRTYNHRLQNLQANKNLTKPQSGPVLLADVPAAERILSAQPVTFADITLINTACQKSVAALASVKVDHHEDLVVPFGIP